MAEQWGDGKPLLLLAGRSNTGKSSLCRLLAPWEKKRVRVGKTPGVTRTFIRIEVEGFTIVDMPGFGFMKAVSRRDEERVQQEIVAFIEQHRHRAFLALHVINLPSFRAIHEKFIETSVPFDEEMHGFLVELGIPTIVIANKADKLPGMQQREELAFLKEALDIQQDDGVILFSTKTKRGLAELEARIDERLAAWTGG